MHSTKSAQSLGKKKAGADHPKPGCLGMGMIASGYRASFWGVDMFQKLDCDDGYTVP